MLLTFDQLVTISCDCDVLIARAFKHKTICAFGADGNGQYGRSPFPKYFSIETVIGTFMYEDPAGESWYTVNVYPHLYRADDDGHIFTDQNLKRSINELLKAEYIDPTCWEWADESRQGQGHFSIKMNVRKLLGC